METMLYATTSDLLDTLCAFTDQLIRLEVCVQINSAELPTR